MKHTGKTILTLLLAILMTVGLAGCGSSRSGSGGSLFSGKSREPVLVRVVATRMEDNAIVSDVHYAYDEYGNQTTKANYQFGLLPNGYSSYEYEYGSGGVPAKRSTYAMAKDFSQLTLEETFDRDGKLTGRREYDNGEIIQEYGYDGSGNMILYVSYSGGEMNYKTESTFDENGDCLTERVTQADGSSDYREYLPYDELNRSHLCSHRVETDADGGETEYDYTIEKDENGYLLTYSIANAATGELLSRDTYVNLYGDNGRLNSIEVTDENGVCTRQEYLRYDEAGNVIQRDSMRDYGTFATRDTFSYAYNDAGVNIQLDYHHYQNNRGEIMESSSVTYYDDQGDMTGYDYETEDGRVSFGIGRVAGKQVVLSKQCTRWNENIRLDFDMVFTGDNEYTEDHTPYDNLDAAFRALDYTRSYTYDDKGNLTAVEEWENGAEMPTQRWDYTYAMPKEAPALHPQAVQLTLGNAPAAVRLYDADDSLLAESFLTYGDHIVTVLERVVRAAADENAGALVRELLDGIIGRKIHLLLDAALGRHMVHGEGIRVHRNGIKKALGALVEAVEQLLTKAAFLRRLLEQQIVIVDDAELVRQRRADLAAAASVLSSNGNDHKDSSFIAKQNGAI